MVLPLLHTKCPFYFEHPATIIFQRMFHVFCSLQEGPWKSWKRNPEGWKTLPEHKYTVLETQVQILATTETCWMTLESLQVGLTSLTGVTWGENGRENDVRCFGSPMGKEGINEVNKYILPTKSPKWTHQPECFWNYIKTLHKNCLNTSSQLLHRMSETVYSESLLRIWYIQFHRSICNGTKR